MPRDSAYRLKTAPMELDPKGTLLPVLLTRTTQTSTRSSFSKTLLNQRLSLNYKATVTFHVHALQLVTMFLFNTAGMGHVVQVVSGTARLLMGRAQLIERSLHIDGVVCSAGKWVCLKKDAA